MFADYYNFLNSQFSFVDQIRHKHFIILSYFKIQFLKINQKHF
jgi:hypothetical protein